MKIPLQKKCSYKTENSIHVKFYSLQNTEKISTMHFPWWVWCPLLFFFFLEFNFHEYKSYKSYTNIWTIIKYVITTIIRVSDTVSLEKELPFQPFSTRFYKPSDNAYWSTYMYNNAFGKLQRWSFSLSQRCCSRTYQHNMLNHSLAANYDNRKLLSSS